MNALSLQAAAEEAPDRLALVQGDTRVDNRSLARRVAGACRELRAAGLDPADPDALVAVTPTVSIDSMVALLACIELGVPFAALHPSLPDAERRRLLEEVRPSLVLPRAVHFDESSGRLPARSVDLARPLAVVFTSGSTGRARPVALSRGALLAAASASASRLPLGAEDRWLLSLPPAHVGGLSVLVRSRVGGGAVQLARDTRFDVEDMRRAFDEGVTVASMVPTMLLRTLDAAPAYRPPKALRAILIGGAAAPATLIERASARGYPVRLTYGLTEASSQVATWASSSWEPGVGRPLPGYEVKIVDACGDRMGVAEQGEIVVRSPSLASGTWPLRESRPVCDEQGFLRTGDLGSLDSEGNLHVRTRRADLIVTGGENVVPGEVERALADVAGVRAACVVGLDDRDLGQRVGAALVLQGTDVRSVLAALRDRLAGFELPRTLCAVSRLPTLPSGKVDRARVARELVASSE